MESSVNPPPSWEEAIAQDHPQDETRPTPLPTPPSRRALAWRNRRYFLIVLVPLLLCPIPIVINNPVRLSRVSLENTVFFVSRLAEDYDFLFCQGKNSANRTIAKHLLPLFLYSSETTTL